MQKQQKTTIDCCLNISVNSIILHFYASFGTHTSDTTSYTPLVIFCVGVGAFLVDIVVVGGVIVARVVTINIVPSLSCLSSQQQHQPQ